MLYVAVHRPLLVQVLQPAPHALRDHPRLVFQEIPAAPRSELIVEGSAAEELQDDVDARAVGACGGGRGGERRPRRPGRGVSDVAGRLCSVRGKSPCELLRRRALVARRMGTEMCGGGEERTYEVLLVVDDAAGSRTKGRQCEGGAGAPFGSVNAGSGAAGVSCALSRLWAWVVMRSLGGTIHIPDPVAGWARTSRA